MAKPTIKELQADYDNQQAPDYWDDGRTQEEFAECEKLKADAKAETQEIAAEFDVWY